jgi:ketosteroid isomerase-like protein
MRFSGLACGLLFGMALTGPALAQPAPRNSNCSANANITEAAQDYMQMHQIEANFHQAATDHNMDLMMSLFAKDATLVAFGKTYAGADQIRRFWQSSGPFTHHWVGYTPAFRIAYKLAGSTGHLYFECLYVDDQDNKVTTHADLNAVVVLRNGKWLLHDLTVTPHRV